MPASAQVLSLPVPALPYTPQPFSFWLLILFSSHKREMERVELKKTILSITQLGTLSLKG